MMILRIAGAIAIVVGLVLAWAPTLVSDPGPAPDLFEAIERHTRWGGLIALGLMLNARTQLKPYRVTAAHAVLWLSTGYLVARGIGLALEGVGNRMQWLWFGIEVALIVGAAAYLRRKHAAATNAAAADD